MVMAFLAVLVVPTRQARAGHIIGIQGGYALQQFGSLNYKAGNFKNTIVRKDLPAKTLKFLDMQGGFLELNYDYTLGLGNVIYLGFGPYFQWAGAKDLSEASKDKLTHFIAVGPEFVLGFNAIPLLDVTVRAGFGFAYAANADWPKNKLGVNWRVIPGITFKFGKVGLFVEAGYVGNWFTFKDDSIKYKESTTIHGAQVGVGLKLYL